ncbi:UDP-N-acetylmuramoyl-L-alanyl-D-glutamate--2,6-diaminopimelate ligase [Patescibacteria group bacterium]|nr:UDP-N-acetylmuramoyl-L-alanyl-D-glutamate--2,6-diaminopimelate ligase [Patescibacteria group bacterium]
MIKNILKKIIPEPVLLFYHWTLSYFAAFIYGYPSNKMIVIGVTGTSGKSTVVNLIGQILKQAGFKVGLATTFNFKIGDKEWENKQKMTMLGRFALQKLLRQMFKAGCQYAVIETSSEGIKQYRHLGINYDIGVFTNLSKEHIESHGSFEKYRKAKQEFFKHLSKCKRKKIHPVKCREAATQHFLKSAGLFNRVNKKTINKVSVVNLDDENKEYFLKFKVDQQYGYGIKIKNQKSKIKIVKAEDIELNSSGSRFKVQGLKFTLNLLGKFNVMNALSSICVGLSQQIDLNICQKVLARVKQIPGRMEVINKQPFTVIVDYAHTPDSLIKVYETIRNSKSQVTNNKQIPITKIQNSKLICVLGSAGGGRDKWKRPIMGQIAEKYGDEIIITNEDPYDESPGEIINQIISGIKSKKAIKILNRKKAIEKALSIARAGDIVIITGKGCEPWIMGPRGERIPWDDREVVREEIKNQNGKSRENF